MAETIISPGVFTRENDISFISPAPVEAGAAIIGPAVKGPVEVPTIVTSFNDYSRKFGTTFESGSSSYEFLTSIAVKNYFSQGGNSVLVSRVVSGSFTRAESTTITNTTTTTGATFASGSITLANNLLNLEARITVGSTVFRFLGADPNNIPADDVDGNVFFFATGSSATATVGTLVTEINAVAALDSQILAVDAGSAKFVISGSSSGTYANGITFRTGSASSFSAGSGFDLGGGTDTTTATTNPFKLETLGKGTIYNNSTAAGDAGALNSDGSLKSGSADNLRYEVSNVNTDLGTFTLSVRRGDDSTKGKVVLETFNNCSLDPNSDSYIEKIVGTQYQELDSSENYIKTVGEYINKSNYVRVSEVGIQTLNYLGTDGLTVGTNTSNISYSASLPIAQSGSFHGATGNIIRGLGGDTEKNLHFKDISSVNTQGLDPVNYANIISVLENTDDYQFNVISAPGLVYGLTNHATQLDSIISLAETRGDCIAVADLSPHGSTVATVNTEAQKLNSSYAAAYWPWVQAGAATGRNEFVPASVVIPGVYAFTDSSAAPWFAPAGLVRGGITGVIQAERRLTRTQRDSLYSKKVNPIASFPGQGISVFGQKTLQTKASALDRVNVRRLLIALKKFIGDQARTLVFEQNTITTRNRFLANVNPYLESVVQRQGLFAFRVVMDDSNNTADVVDRNQLIGQIFIQPAKTAEFIVLDFTIEPTGATFAG